MTTTLTCPCGQVRVDIDAEPEIAFYCHCDDCRAVTGGAYLSVALYPSRAVKVHGETTTWTLRTLPRQRCSTCGASMVADVAAFDQIGVVGTRLPPGAMQPAFHIHCRLAVLPVADDLPHYADTPVDFGGSGKTVDW